MRFITGSFRGGRRSLDVKPRFSLRCDRRRGSMPTRVRHPPKRLREETNVAPASRATTKPTTKKPRTVKEARAAAIRETLRSRREGSSSTAEERQKAAAVARAAAEAERRARADAKEQRKKEKAAKAAEAAAKKKEKAAEAASRKAVKAAQKATKQAEAVAKKAQKAAQLERRQAEQRERREQREREREDAEMEAMLRRLPPCLFDGSKEGANFGSLVQRCAAAVAKEYKQYALSLAPLQEETIAAGAFVSSWLKGLIGAYVRVRQHFLSFGTRCSTPSGLTSLCGVAAMLLRRFPFAATGARLHRARRRRPPRKDPVVSSMPAIQYN